MKTHGSEGLEFINQEIIAKQRSTITYMIKKIGSNLLSGKSIMSTSLPIYIFDYKSLLDSHAYNYKIIEKFLTRAVEASNLERLKLITCAEIASLHLHIIGLKPFNPILGETFQAKIGDSHAYYEQTSHHPPIYNYYIKNKNYMSYGYSALEAYTGANSATAEFKGGSYVQFNNGGLYKISRGKFKMTGITMGKRYSNYSGLIVEDLVS
jgi:hypothetical protein